MNFANIYRESLKRMIEETQLSKLEKDELDKKILGVAIKIILQVYNSGKDFTQNTKDILSAFLKEWTNESLKNGPQGLSKSYIEMCTATPRILEEKSTIMSGMCGDLNISKEDFGGILSFIRNVCNVSIDVHDCFNEFNQKKQEAIKKASKKRELTQSEFRSFYLSKRQKALENSQNKSMDSDLFNKVDDIYKKFKSSDLSNVSEDPKFFTKIDSGLSWMDALYPISKSEFIFGSELDFNSWLELVMGIEQDIISNGIEKSTEKSAEESFKEVFDDFTELQKKFDEIMKDPELRKFMDSNDKARDFFSKAGMAISGASLAFGALTYILGAFIPGGSYFSQYLSKLSLWGRRAGKLITNKGNSLNKKNIKDREKNSDVVIEKDKKSKNLSVDHRHDEDDE